MKITGSAIPKYPLKVPRGCIFYLDMGGPGVFATDHSHMGRHATVSGALPRAGVRAPAREFDGADDYLVTAAAMFGTGGDMSYEIWFNASGWGEADGGYMISDGQVVISVDGTNSQVSYTIDNFGFANSTGANTIVLNQWYQFVLTADTSGLIYAYVNAIELDEDYLGIPVAGSNLYIGDASVGTRAFDGKIGIVRVHNRVLTAADVKALYQQDAWRYALSG